MPPTRWTPTTSSESSKPNLYFRPTAHAHAMPTTTPRTIEPTGLSDPQAGVIATRPATAPDAAPTLVGLPSRSFSGSNQPRMAAHVATQVLTHTMPVSLTKLAANAVMPPWEKSE